MGWKSQKPFGSCIGEKTFRLAQADPWLFNWIGSGLRPPIKLSLRLTIIIGILIYNKKIIDPFVSSLFITVSASFMYKYMYRYIDIYAETYIDIYIYLYIIFAVLLYMGDAYHKSVSVSKPLHDVSAMNSGRRLAGEPPVKQPREPYPDPPPLLEDESVDVVHGALAAIYHLNVPGMNFI